MRLEWTEALSVGVDEIDDQHRELFRRAARLLDGLQRGRPEEIGPLIGFLYAHVVGHFGAEEDLMRATRYPGYLRHKAEHDHFIADLLDVSADLERGGAGAFMALKVNHWVNEWLKEHVSGTDAELGRYVARPRTA